MEQNEIEEKISNLQYSAQTLSCLLQMFRHLTVNPNSRSMVREFSNIVEASVISQIDRTADENR